jgi:hypothetical protein
VRTKRTKGSLIWDGPVNVRMGGFEFWSAQEHSKSDFEEYVIVSLDNFKYAIIRYVDGEEDSDCPNIVHYLSVLQHATGLSCRLGIQWIILHKDDHDCSRHSSKLR